MKKFILFFLVCSVCLFPAFAFAETDSAIVDSGSSPIVLETPRLMSVSVSNERVTASDSNGFKAVVLGLLGDYETVITDYTYQSSSGYTTHSIEIEQDWSWIMSAVLFIVIIYCTFVSVAKILQRF